MTRSYLSIDHEPDAQDRLGALKMWVDNLPLFHLGSEDEFEGGAAGRSRSNGPLSRFRSNLSD